MDVSLPIALEEFVRHKVANGEFRSADEVVCEGLQLLREQDAWKAEVRQKIDVGWQQAQSGQLQTLEQTRLALDKRKEDWKHGIGR